MHPAEIFVSYSSRDRALVFPIVEQLKQQGLSVWFDSQRLQGGMKWAQQIVQAIKKCRVFVFDVLRSGSSIRGPWLKRFSWPGNTVSRIFPSFCILLKTF